MGLVVVLLQEGPLQGQRRVRRRGAALLQVQGAVHVAEAGWLQQSGARREQVHDGPGGAGDHLADRGALFRHVLFCGYRIRSGTASVRTDLTRLKLHTTRRHTSRGRSTFDFSLLTLDFRF